MVANFPTGSTNWSLDGSGSVRDLIGPNGLNVTGVCMGCVVITGGPAANGPAANGLAGGLARTLLLGADARQSITTINARDTNNGKTLTGAAAGVR